MKYLFKITAQYSDKNKLEASFKKFIQTLDGTLIRKPAALESFKKMLQKQLETFHVQYSRCKPLELQFFKFKEMDFQVMVSNSWTASFYEVKNEVSIDGDGFLQYEIPEVLELIKEVSLEDIKQMEVEFEEVKVI